MKAAHFFAAVHVTSLRTSSAASHGARMCETDAQAVAIADALISIHFRVMSEVGHRPYERV
jgi:hypothetical protein